MELSTGYYNTFIIRIWKTEPQGKIRGYVQHAHTQEKIYFTELSSMNEFIEKNLNPPIKDFLKNENTFLN